MTLIDFNRDLDDLITKAEEANLTAEQIKNALQDRISDIEDAEEDEEDDSAA